MENEDELDFGGDSDTEDTGYLSAKLAALGIDEDAELSGADDDDADAGMEDDLDPAPTTTQDCPPSGEERAGPGLGTQTGTRGDAATAVADVEPGEMPDVQGTHADASNPSNDAQELLEKPLASGGGPPQELDQALKTGRERGGGARRPSDKGRSAAGGQRSRRGRWTIKESAMWACEQLKEPKYYLMCRVVYIIGFKKLRSLLRDVRNTQRNGGMLTVDKKRKRTAGGVFFTLLKDCIKPETLKEIYAEERAIKKEKERARRGKKRPPPAPDARASSPNTAVAPEGGDGAKRQRGGGEGGGGG